MKMRKSDRTRTRERREERGERLVTRGESTKVESDVQLRPKADHQLFLCFFGDCAIQRVRDNHQGQEFVQLDAGHVMVKPLRSGSQPQPQPASDRPGGLKDAGSVSCQLKVYPPRDFMQVSSFFSRTARPSGFLKQNPGETC